MPLDIRLFRAHEGGNPEVIRESQRRRFKPVEAVDEIIQKDDQWRFMTGSIDQLRAKRNAVQKVVAGKKKAGEPCDELVAEIKTFGEEIDSIEKAQGALRVEIDKLVGKIGNIVDDSVPISNDEDTGNRVERQWGIPRDPLGLLNHSELLWRIGGYEPERGARVAGHRGVCVRVCVRERDKRKSEREREMAKCKDKDNIYIYIKREIYIYIKRYIYIYIKRER